MHYVSPLSRLSLCFPTLVPLSSNKILQPLSLRLMGESLLFSHTFIFQKGLLINGVCRKTVSVT